MPITVFAVGIVAVAVVGMPFKSVARLEHDPRALALGEFRAMAG